jgi:ribosomal protein L32
MKEIVVVNPVTLGLGSLKSAMDTLKSLNATITEAEVAKVRVEISGHLIAANAAMLDVQRTLLEDTDIIRALEAENMQLKDWSREAERYELDDVGQGAVAYALKPECTGSGAAHHLCPNCFTQRKRSFLQPEWLVDGQVETFRCHPCGLTLFTRGNADQVATRGTI